jgi:ribonuclease T2
MTALSANETLTAGDVRRAFVAANPGLERPMISVQSGRGGWLDEVRLCLDRRFAWAACPVGERGASDGARIRVTARR